MTNVPSYLPTEAELLESIRAFLNHDVRGSIGSATTFLKLLIDEGDEMATADERQFLDLSLENTAASFNILENIRVMLQLRKDGYPDAEEAPQRFDVSNIIKELLAIDANLIQQHNLTLAQEISEGILMPGNEDLTRTALQSLIYHLVRHTAKNHTISLKVSDGLLSVSSSKYELNSLEVDRFLNGDELSRFLSHDPAQSTWLKADDRMRLFMIRILSQRSYLSFTLTEALDVTTFEFSF